MEGLLEEMNRVRELIKEYEAIDMGFVAAALMKQGIVNAENAIGSGDVVAMLVAYEDLKGYTG